MPQFVVSQSKEPGTLEEASAPRSGSACAGTPPLIGLDRFEFAAHNGYGWPL